MKVDDKEPLVAIWMLTYNQEKYIAQAIESILFQKVGFEIKIFIGEDCSTDDTRNICIDFERKYPKQVKVISTPENNINTNSRNIYKACFDSGAKYIAMCEGDDYWYDQFKLQKQVNFLETNSNYAASCGDVYELTDSVMKRVFSKSNIITGKELATGNKIYTCSVVFRNIISLPEWFWECKMGDWILWLLLAQHGNFYNLSEPIAVYRIHQKGLWIGKGKEKNLIDILAAYEILMANTQSNYIKDLKFGAKQHYIHLLNLLSSKRSGIIFYWTYKAFKFDFDLKWFKFLIRYFINSLKFRTNAVKG